MGRRRRREAVKARERRRMGVALVRRKSSMMVGVRAARAGRGWKGGGRYGIGGVVVVSWDGGGGREIAVRGAWGAVG